MTAVTVMFIFFVVLLNFSRILFQNNVMHDWSRLAACALMLLPVNKYYLVKSQTVHCNCENVPPPLHNIKTMYLCLTLWKPCSGLRIHFPFFTADGNSMSFLWGSLSQWFMNKEGYVPANAKAAPQKDKWVLYRKDEEICEMLGAAEMPLAPPLVLTIHWKLKRVRNWICAVADWLF